MELPILFVRYEDLSIEPEKVLSELFCFILGLESIKGKNIEHRIKDAIKNEHLTWVYKRKGINKQFNENIHRFSPELKKEINSIMKNFAYFFGYANVPD